MEKYMKWATVLLVIGLYATFPVLAQDEAAGPNIFANRPTLWIAIIIGFLATAATLVNAYQLKGGVIGKALMIISSGMFLVVLGFLAVVVSWAEADIQATVHDVVFIIGYILMFVGAIQLKQMIR